jgi:hypothetical protein
MSLSRSVAPALLLSLLLAACGGPLKYEVRGSELSAGSDAKIVAAVDEGRRVTELDIDALNLTPPDRLLPNGTTLIVWVRKDSSGQWQRLGALELDGDKREGKAHFTANETAFDLIISAEVDASPGSPSGKTVFSQRVEKK